MFSRVKLNEIPKCLALEQINFYTTGIHVKSFDSIPGPKSFPLIGTLWTYLPIIGMYRFDRLHVNGLLKLRKYGPVVREDIVPGVPIVWIFKPEDIEMMYRCEGRYPQRRSHLALEKYRLDKPEMYNSGGLLPTNGPEWWRIRKNFQSNLSKIQNVRLYLTKSDQVIKHFLNSRANIENDFLPELSRLFLELIGLVTFDESLGCFEEHELKPNSRSAKLIESAANINSVILSTDNGLQFWKKFNTPLYNRMSRAHSYIETVAQKFVFKKLQDVKTKSKDSKYSLLEQYLLNEKLDIKDVLGMIVDMLIAGIDTMAYTSCFALNHISKNQDKQYNMFKELCSVMSSDDAPITENMLQKCVYTKAVMKEIFRMNPISVGIGRILLNEAIFSNYHVPAGTVVVTQNQVSCRLPEYFPNPEKFMPERWMKEDPFYRQVHPYLVLPFGYGPRTCIARRLAEQNLQLLLMNGFGIAPDSIEKCKDSEYLKVVCYNQSDINEYIGCEYDL